MEPVWREVVAGALGVLAVAVAAQLSAPVPLSPVPQSAQTLAVLAVGIVLGWRLAAVSLAAYVVIGALGLPVFADGAAGARHLSGPTAGYLAGFVVAGALAGWWVERGLARNLAGALGGMLLAHAVILGCGWLRLAALVSPVEAWTGGVAPFVGGAALKSALAAALAIWVTHRRRPGE